MVLGELTAKNGEWVRMHSPNNLEVVHRLHAWHMVYNWKQQEWKRRVAVRVVVLTPALWHIQDRRCYAADWGCVSHELELS